MVTERQVVDQITFQEFGEIQVRTATVVLRDGVEITRMFHRHVVAPGDNLDAEDPRVKALAQIDHTPERVAAFLTARALAQ